MDPQVIHLIMCDRAYSDPRNLHRLNIAGLQLRIRARQPPPIYYDCCVLVMMVGFAGSGELWLQVVEQATDRAVFRGRRHAVRFPPDLDEVFGTRFQMDRCPLPRYGRYRLELWLDDEVIGARPFWLLPRT
jgi:Family of unknown function (DUF6941)